MRRDVHALWKDKHITQNGAGTDSIILDNTETVQGQIPSFWTILGRWLYIRLELYV